MIEFLGLWERLHNPDFKPLEFEGLENRLAQMLLQCHLRNGLKQQMMPLVLFQKQDAMEEHMPIAILPCLSRNMDFSRVQLYIMKDYRRLKNRRK